jgi:azurin/DNA-binding transcriptional ArsR family regulator
MPRYVRLAAVLTSLWGSAFFAGVQDPVRIILDASPRAVEYQLRRLTNDELMRVERKEGDVRYRPVYMALLTRKGLGREYFDEALTALTGLDKSGKSAVLLEALSKVAADDEETGEKLLRVLLAQPAETLRAERQLFAHTIEEAPSRLALRASYGAMMIADGTARSSWEGAQKHEGHLVELLRSVPYLGSAGDVRRELFDPVAALLAQTTDSATRAAAVTALACTRADTATFRLLTREVLQSADSEVRIAAVRGLQQIPREAWPSEEIEPLARAVAAMVAKTSPEKRTEPANVEAIQLAEKLSNALPAESGRSIRRELRAIGVQIVRIDTIPEQMMFDLKWFAVEAGKPLQIVLRNPDAMSHNLLITKPGALKEVGTAASTMTLSADPTAKPYVPDTPLVLHATRLLQWGETERLSFQAPKEPGEYPFVCTFPGHWVRMYGVMLVVTDLEAWEANRTVPKDPMTNQPYASQRN